MDTFGTKDKAFRTRKEHISAGDEHAENTHLLKLQPHTCTHAATCTCTRVDASHFQTELMTRPSLLTGTHDL